MPWSMDFVMTVCLEKSDLAASMAAHGLNPKIGLPVVFFSSLLGAEIGRRSSDLTWQSGFDRAVLLVVSLDKGEFYALIPQGARLAFRLGSTRDTMAAFTALDGWGSLYFESFTPPNLT